MPTLKYLYDAQEYLYAQITLDDDDEIVELETYQSPGMVKKWVAE